MINSQDFMREIKRASEYRSKAGGKAMDKDAFEAAMIYGFVASARMLEKASKKEFVDGTNRFIEELTASLVKIKGKEWMDNQRIAIKERTDDKFGV